MKDGQLLTAFPLLDVNGVVPTWAIVLALVVVIIIVTAAVFLMRGGKKKDADAINPGDWQQQQGGWNQPQPGANWNQQQQQGNNPWGTQQPTAAWGNQQQQPMGATNAWGSSQPAATNPWEQQQQQQQQPAATANPWAAQPQQQPPAAANPWVAQPQQQPPAAANPWAAQPQQQPPAAANPWVAQPQQQPATTANPWAAQPQPQQQPATTANPWATQPQQQPTTNQWGNQAPTVAAQEPWNQQQQGTPPQNWSQPVQQDAWNVSNMPQPNQLPANNNPAASGWQQQPGLGGSAATGGGLGGPNTTGGFGQNDADKTILRAGGTPSVAGGVGYVRVEEGKEPGRTYEVRKEALSIGRSRESDIFLEDLAVSRLHASIVNMGNNSYALKDEGSANGTKVNGQLVNKFQTYPLQEGDRIQLGQTVLVFARH